jgi:RNA polymerase sigma-70 factor (ECF subfamily)
LTSLEELAQRTVDGDKDAFGDIYGTLLDPMYRFLYWNLDSREDAEDLTEEVFLRCLVNIEAYNPKRGSFKTWAFRIAHNALIDHHRRRIRRPQDELKEDMINGAMPVAERLVEGDKVRALRSALSDLNPTQRQVIVMKYYAEMSNAEVAQALGRSVGAINAIQHRALRRMGKTLQESGWL